MRQVVLAGGDEVPPPGAHRFLVVEPVDGGGGVGVPAGHVVGDVGVVAGAGEVAQTGLGGGEGRVVAADGEERGILCNSRLLSEGIDVRAVDAVCFADPKSSVIDIVQAVGRRCASPTSRARSPGSSSRSTCRRRRSATTRRPRTRPRSATPGRP
ncbi:helicase-related protein [Streptomyces sp. SP17BM10]|uniref:helicase-related protein n=1 Tax=Streptomyces sp. SP17BM10 TaxID=3002530 RepID=UPI002E79A2AA|nr:helicase-related protein [Streptomyces sp. SP17BM10]MEE1782775.1 helicase-related protein [Streptomyces sp. SP17BM10]